jgi:hypothetical protein
MDQAVTARSNRIRRAPGRRQAPAGHVVWVYAITKDLAPDQLAGLTGVGGEPIRAVTEAGLTAVAGSVGAGEFGEQARAELMSDLARIERLARAHHQVIACVAAAGPVLPLRLATVYPDDQTVRTLLGRSSAGFAVVLDSLRGTEEWGVKVYAGAEDAAAPEAAQAGPADEAVAGMIDRALAGIAIASRHQIAQDPRFDSGEKCTVLNAAYLVLSDRAAEFTAVARALATAHRGMGADLTGPWPPYSFADIRPSLCSREAVSCLVGGYPAASWRGRGRTGYATRPASVIWRTGAGRAMPTRRPPRCGRCGCA